MLFSLVYFWLLCAFIFGIVVGSFLNVCVARLPLEKNLLWPGSRCGHCFQSLRWYDNLPILGYLLLRGKCRTCKTPYSVRYLMVELLTGLGFVGLFYLEVVLNIHGWYDPRGMQWAIDQGLYPVQAFIGFGFHAILFSLLMVATFCDLAGREIPLSVTLPGTALGLIGAILMPWPYPNTEETALREVRARQETAAKQFADFPGQQREQPWWAPPVGWTDPGVSVKQGIYPWPVFAPLPTWLKPGSWQMGLLTGLAGIFVGTFMLRFLSFIFSRALGKDALGLGDADLMMMAGAFLGWQPIIIAFFISVFPALFVGIFLLLTKKDRSLPFGPSLAIGIMAAMLLWGYIGPEVQILFFWPALLGVLFVISLGFLVLATFALRLLR